MPTGATLLTFAAATLAILVIPGPSVVYVMTRSIEQGRRAGLYSMLGLETGALLHVLATAVGLAALLASSELAFTIIRYGGAGYLLYLGARQLRTRARGLDLASGLTSASRRRLYRDGVLVDLLNPKTALFFVAFLPQFVDPSRGSEAGQIATLGLCFVALAVLCDGSYAIAAGGLGRRIQASSGAQLRIGRATGGVYVGLAALTAFG